jgi:hypothetical protein
VDFAQRIHRTCVSSGLLTNQVDSTVAEGEELRALTTVVPHPRFTQHLGGPVEDELTGPHLPVALLQQPDDVQGHAREVLSTLLTPAARSDVVQVATHGPDVGRGRWIGSGINDGEFVLRCLRSNARRRSDCYGSSYDSRTSRTLLGS